MPLEGIICRNWTSYININSGMWEVYNTPQPTKPFFLATPWGHWDLSSLTRDRIPSPCYGSVGSDHWTPREVPVNLPSTLARFLRHQLCRDTEGTDSLPPRRCRLCITRPPQDVGNRKPQCSPIPLGTSWEAGIPSFLISLGRDLTQLWSKGLHLSSAGDLKRWSTFWGDIVGVTWLSFWNFQPPKHWPRSSLPPVFWFSVVTKALWFQSALILSVLFTLWGSLKTSRFRPNTWNGFHGMPTLVYLMVVVGSGMVAVLLAVWACFALLWVRMLEFFVTEYILRGECDNLKYFWKQHKTVSSSQEILLSSGEGNLFPGSWRGAMCPDGHNSVCLGVCVTCWKITGGMIIFPGAESTGDYSRLVGMFLF